MGPFFLSLSLFLFLPLLLYSSSDFSILLLYTFSFSLSHSTSNLFVFELLWYERRMFVFLETFELCYFIWYWHITLSGLLECWCWIHQTLSDIVNYTFIKWQISNLIYSKYLTFSLYFDSNKVLFIFQKLNSITSPAYSHFWSPLSWIYKIVQIFFCNCFILTICIINFLHFNFYFIIIFKSLYLFGRRQRFISFSSLQHDNTTFKLGLNK